MRDPKTPTFVFDGMPLADMLVTASNITRFLADMAPHLAPTGGYLGLSSGGAEGLAIILDALDNTINEALGLYEPGLCKAGDGKQEANP